MNKKYAHQSVDGQSLVELGLSREKCEVHVQRWTVVKERLRGNFLIHTILFRFSYSYSLSLHQKEKHKKRNSLNSSVTVAWKWLKLVESLGVEWPQLQRRRWYMLFHVSHLQGKNFIHPLHKTRTPPTWEGVNHHHYYPDIKFALSWIM